MNRRELEAYQLVRLNELLEVVRTREFYADRLADIAAPLTSLEQISRLPLLTKEDMVGDAAQPVGKIFDLPRSHYSRLHQTSGTHGFPMAVLDTADDWRWFLDCWDHVFVEAEVTSADVAMLAFSFGPFIGFWAANDALIRLGTLVVPGGGLNSEARLRMIESHGCTLVCCTPTYALHLAAVADSIGMSLADGPVTRVIVAGEPGGSVPSTRARIEQAWGARLIDHSGASEVGAWGVGSADGRGIHVIETEFIAELLQFTDSHPEGVPAADGEESELVLTGLGRLGGPVIRYRTGDTVRGYRDHAHECPFLYLDGGVIGRTDDMVVIRGINVFPSSIESIVRELDGAAEFRMIVTRQNEMDQLELEVEGNQQRADELARRLKDRLAIRTSVIAVPEQSLPRFEAKAKRLVDRRES